MISKEKEKKSAPVTLITSSKLWMDSEAIRQLNHTARLPGMKLAVGLPDLHPGKEHPIGAAFLTEGWIYPQLVGNDIGCGMGLWAANIPLKKFTIDKAVKALKGLNSPWDGDINGWRQVHGLQESTFDRSLGTIGKGNHFAELQKIEQIGDDELFNRLALRSDSLYLLVHSGSRGLGEHILQEHLGAHGSNGLQDGSVEAQQYLVKHQQAVQWAEANRALIAHRFLACLSTRGELILTVNHNTVTQEKMGEKYYWVHRKGAAPANQGCVIIPGSRGHCSYLVHPTVPQASSGYSLAHGAGRKWKRSEAKGKLSKYQATDLVKTSLNSKVICEDKNLLFEEAPHAYKNIEAVIEALLNAGLITVVAILKPLITYKIGKSD